MSRSCDLTGKRRLVGNKVSHANNKTKMTQKPNLQTKRVFDPETGKTIKCTLDHNFYRPERPENKIGYTDLKIGDSLYTLEKDKAIEEKITNIEIIKTMSKKIDVFKIYSRRL